MISPLLACLYENTESYCSHFDVGIGVGVFTSKFTYVLGKALSGELSCTGTGLIDKISDVKHG